MSDLPDFNFNDYQSPPMTVASIPCSNEIQPEVEVPESIYGINKPVRIIISAKISHGKSKDRKTK